MTLVLCVWFGAGRHATDSFGLGQNARLAVRPTGPAVEDRHSPDERPGSSTEP